MPIDKVIKFAPGESAMDHWFVRCLLDAKRRQATALLCILTSMHRRVRDDLSPILDGIFPRFGDACKITASGQVLAKFQTAPGEPIREQLVGTTKQIEGAMRRCADRCKLTDDERKALFAWFNDWIQEDKRAKSVEE
jgi:hypothetical protein